MAIQYNLDFLYVSLIVSLLIFGHFKSQPSPGSVNDRIFSLFFVVGIADILFDIITTQLILHQSIAYAEKAEKELDRYQKDLLHELRRYQVKDPMVWLHQIPALLDKKEMVEIRHGLIIRRQSLRRRMDYNKEVIAGKAQAEIKDLVEKYPKYAKEILSIVGEYEKNFS